MKYVLIDLEKDYSGREVVDIIHSLLEDREKNISKRIKDLEENIRKLELTKADRSIFYGTTPPYNIGTYRDCSCLKPGGICNCILGPNNTVYTSDSTISSNHKTDNFGC